MTAEARALAACSTGLAVLAAGCAAATDPLRPGAVTVEGCPEPGVEEAGCLMLRSSCGRLYDITVAWPAPPIGGGTVRIIGILSKATTLCMQGTPLADIAWTTTGGACRS